MSSFIALENAEPGSIRTYKRHVRAIVIDRAAYHLERALRGRRRPAAKRYQVIIDDSLARAKLDVMAEIFGHMRDLSRPRAVAGWTRGGAGLVRRARKPGASLAMINGYLDVVRYIGRLKASEAPGNSRRAR